MSWNFGTRLNNLQIQVNNLAQTSLTNPLTAPLGCASYPINNATQLSATPGQNLAVNVSSGSNITLNGPVNVPNHPLTITNNTNNDSFVVTDEPGDTNVFRIDAFGNVGVLQNPSITLPTGLSVGGPITCSNIIASNVVSSITAGNPSIQMGGTQTNRTVSLAPSIQVDDIQSSNTNAEINFNATTTPGWNNNSVMIKNKNDDATYTAIFNTATGESDLPQINTGTIDSITGGAINVNKSLNLGSNNLTCATLNYTTLNPPITDAGITQIIPEVGISATVAGNQAYIGNTGVIALTAGSNISIDASAPRYPIISATIPANTGLNSVSSTNNGLAVSAVSSNTQSLTSSYIGVALFQYSSNSPVGSYINPGQTLTINFTPITSLANSILKNYSGNVALYFSYCPSLYFDGFVDFTPADTLSASISTDAQGSANGSDNNRATNNFQDQTACPTFNIVCESNTFTDASNTIMSINITNNCAIASFMPILLPNIIRCDVFETSNFAPV
jgi:hypothetical protein